MKQNKRKRKVASAATSVAEPLVPVASSSATAPAPLAFALDANCTIREGATLKSALLQLVGSGQTVVLDVQAVERVDTAALQLLCAFVHDRRARGRNTNWIGSPPAFTDAVEILGLTQALGYAAETTT